MKIQPFRIKASEDLEDFSEVFDFIIHGSKKGKAPYEVEISIDRLNDLGITNTKCTCPHFQFRGEQIEGKCKHINLAIEILEEYGILEKETDNADKINNDDWVSRPIGKVIITKEYTESINNASPEVEE